MIKPNIIEVLDHLVDQADAVVQGHLVDQCVEAQDHRVGRAVQDGAEVQGLRVGQAVQDGVVVQGRRVGHQGQDHHGDQVDVGVQDHHASQGLQNCVEGDLSHTHHNFHKAMKL